ncbi:hypothetical protein, partial [Stenotrophomonas maltophilia]|uniref:hypothetical protein n=1 Tax=Stenotrophomonas maltophilia TaxID=40324 RepID=UPI0034E1D109
VFLGVGVVCVFGGFGGVGVGGVFCFFFWWGGVVFLGGGGFFFGGGGGCGVGLFFGFGVGAAFVSGFFF